MYGPVAEKRRGVTPGLSGVSLNHSRGERYEHGVVVVIAVACC